MSRRIQITLSNDQFAFLDEEADRSSVSIAELIRRAIDTTYLLSEPPLVSVINHTAGRRGGRPVDGRRWRPSPDYFSPSQ